MSTEPGSNGWYYDENIGEDVWTNGAEAWCNLEGQYLSIISDMSDRWASDASYAIHLCSVGIMGTSYVRDEPLQE